VFRQNVSGFRNFPGKQQVHFLIKAGSLKKLLVRHVFQNGNSL